MRKQLFRILLALSLVTLVIGCGGGSRPGTRLVSISIQGSGSVVPLGSVVALTATGTYSEGATVSVTSSVSWASSNTAVATVSSAGVVTALSAGSTTISATSGTVSASYPITVFPLGGSVQGGLTLSGTLSVLAGSSGSPGVVDATGTNARFNVPSGMVTDGQRLYVADSQNNLIRVVDIASGAVSTLAGSGLQASTDGTGTSASFYHPESIACDGTFLYIAESQSGKIRRVDRQSGAVTTLTTSSALTRPSGITTDGVNLYVTDAIDHVVRRIVIASGAVSLVAGSAGSPGSTNAVGSSASFNQPVGITTDGSNLYVNDFGNGRVRKIVIASGAVTTLAPSFTTPAGGITTDGTNLYVADYGNIVWQVNISIGTATILATGLNHPDGVVSDGHALFVADRDNHVIRRIN